MRTYNYFYTKRKLPINLEDVREGTIQAVNYSSAKKKLKDLNLKNYILIIVDE